MSGRLCFGSSWGKGSNWILLVDPLIAITRLAHSRIVNSVRVPNVHGCRVPMIATVERCPSISSLT